MFSGVDPCLDARIDPNANRHPAVQHTFPGPLHTPPHFPSWREAHRYDSGQRSWSILLSLYLVSLSSTYCASQTPSLKEKNNDNALVRSRRVPLPGHLRVFASPGIPRGRVLHPRLSHRSIDGSPPRMVSVLSELLRGPTSNPRSDIVTYTKACSTGRNGAVWSPTATK